MINTPLKCELCGHYFIEGYLAAKPDGQFGWMCDKCFKEIYLEAVTDD